MQGGATDGAGKHVPGVVMGPRIHALSAVPMSEAQKRRLGALGELRYWDVEVGDPSIVERVGEAEILVITPRIPADIAPHLNGCRLIAVQATGVDAFNLEACRELGVTVCNVPAFSTDAVAEHAFALLLAAAKRLEEGRPLLRSGAWNSALAYFTLGLKGSALGLFGCGRIGLRIAEIGRAFGMEVIAHVRDPGKQRPVETAGFDELLARSDFLVLAAPATPDTVERFDAKAFAMMKPNAVLVNVARGSLIVDADLIGALDQGRLAAAALDVFRTEPPAPDDPLLSHPKIVVTPHVAWGTPEAIARVQEITIDNVEAFLAGRPQNVVV
jgi:glycerate dehydrogenase